MAGNYYENNVQLGRSDADFGSILVNNGGSKFVIPIDTRYCYQRAGEKAGG